jgi:hypothetical protein
MVNVAFPAGVLGPVVTVSVEFTAGPVGDGLIEDGLNVAAAPAGNPLTLKVTAPLNPFTAATLTT